MARYARIAIIVIPALALSVVAVRDSLANATRTRNPALAAQLAPGDGMVLDRLVELRLTEAIAQQNTDFAPATLAMAREAVRAEPFAISSLTTLALAARDAQDDERANLLLDHAGSLSRRELRLELLLIERYARTMELGPLMEEIDGTLRVFQSSYPTIFPILTRFLTEPELQARLREIAADDPAWFRLFVGQALTEPDALPAIRELLTSQPESAAATAPDIRRGLVAQLIATGRIPEARDYFFTLHPGEADRLIIDPEFEHPDYEAPLGWTIGQDPDLTADFILDEGLGLYSARGREGVAAQQLTRLAPGRYAVTLAGDAESLERVYLDVQCVGTGGVRVVPGAGDGSYLFELLQGCRDQVIGLALRDSGDIAGTEAYIRSIAIARVAR